MQDARASAGLCMAPRRAVADPSQSVCPAAHRRRICDRWWLLRRRRRTRRLKRRRKSGHDGPCHGLRCALVGCSLSGSPSWCNGEAAGFRGTLPGRHSKLSTLAQTLRHWAATRLASSGGCYNELCSKERAAHPPFAQYSLALSRCGKLARCLSVVISASFVLKPRQQGLKACIEPLQNCRSITNRALHLPSFSSRDTAHSPCLLVATGSQCVLGVSIILLCCAPLACLYSPTRASAGALVRCCAWMPLPTCCTQTRRPSQRILPAAASRLTPSCSAMEGPTFGPLPATHLVPQQEQRAL